MKFTGGAAQRQDSDLVAGSGSSAQTEHWRNKAKKRAVICALGAILMVAGAKIKDSGGLPLQGGALVTGQVVAPSGSHSDDETCTKAVRYVVDGVDYYVRPPAGSSSSCGDLGTMVRVSYLPNDPRIARVVANTASLGLLLGILGPLIFIVFAFLTVAALRRSKRTNMVTAEATATGGPAVSRSDLTSTNRPPTGVPLDGPPPVPPPVVQPPPGWYLDPDDDAVQRWWDGREWTEHRR